MLNQLVPNLLTALLKGVISVYTYSTLPLYYIKQKPWVRLSLANERQAAREDTLDPGSAWRRITNDPKLDAFEVDSVDSLLMVGANSNGKNCPIVGVKVRDSNKYFYDWFTYGHVIYRVNNIAKGLQLLGVGPGDKVLMFAETRLEWVLCMFAVYKLGAVLTTIFAQLGTDGIIHSISQVIKNFPQIMSGMAKVSDSWRGGSSYKEINLVPEAARNRI